MAVPSYTEDLTDITLAETTTGFSAYGGGASGLGAGADLAMQGSNCVDKQITNADKGMYFDNGSGITLGAGDHVFVWLFNATPGLSDTLALKGASILVGSGSNAYCQYHVEGNDTYGAAGRVAKCYPIDYTTRSSNTGSVPYRTVTGSPAANPQVFGGGLVTTASVKGANLGIDAMRYGTGAYITAGEIANPATFAGFQAQNDAIANRWGILTGVGATYELQGTFAIGQNNAGTATLAYFSDADVSVSIVDTPHSATDFSKIVIDHASTEVYWTNITITALGTNNPGQVVVNNAATVVEITGGTWTDIGITTLRAACVVDGLTWRTSGQVTANGASISNALFDRSSASTALSIADLDLLDNCEFVSDGTGYAIDLGTIAATDTMGWNCTDTGYAAQGGTATNRTILVNVASGQTLTINVAAGATTPTYNNTGAGTVTIVSGQVTTTITVVDIDDGLPIENANVYVVAAAGGPLTAGDVIIGASTLTNASGVVTDTRSLGSNQPITGRVRRASPGFGTLYKTSPIAGTINSASGLDLTIQMIKDE